MTNPNNGATLEDCHSNFFALTDLCGIKWRRLVSEGNHGSGHSKAHGPLEDHVLSSYARCLASDILCVWRRSPNQKNSLTSTNPIDFVPSSSAQQTHHVQLMSSNQTSSQQQLNLPPHLSQPHMMPPQLPVVGMGPGHMPSQMCGPPSYPQGPSSHPQGMSSHPPTSSHSHAQFSPQMSPMHQQGASSNPLINNSHPSLNGPKELWIFWFGEQPDLNGLVSPLLLKAESEQGSWENGLSYECRSLLFKALHNLIEKCLLARNFARIGKWFIQPNESIQNVGLNGFPSQLSFSFTFFVHGESTVCMSVNVSQHPAVRRVTKLDLISCQCPNTVLPVILAPHGLAGTLTGASFKLNDPGACKILEEWKQFYPVEAALRSSLCDMSSNNCQSSHNSNGPPNKSFVSRNLGIPPIVEIMVGGVKMRYPSCYVLLTEMDDLNKKASPSSNPVAPRSKQNPSCDSESASYPTGASPGKPHDLLIPDPVDRVEDIFSERVWQDSVLGFSKINSTESNTSNISTSSSNSPQLGQWDYLDPLKRSSCFCSKCKRSSSSKVGHTGNSSGHSSRGSSRSKKLSFHKRPVNQFSFTENWINAWDAMEKTARPATTETASASTNFTKENPSTNPNNTATAGPGTPIGGPPSYKATLGRSGTPLAGNEVVGASPASINASPLATPHSQPASVPQPEITLPLMSPHQTFDKLPHGTPETSAPKSVSSVSNQVLSPFTVNYGAKPESIETSLEKTQNHSSEGPSLDTPYPTTCSHTSQKQGFERPSLPSKEYEVLVTDDTHYLSEGFCLYDYKSLEAWLHHPVKKMKLSENRDKITKYDWGIGLKNTPEFSRNYSNQNEAIRNGKRAADPYEFDEDNHSTPAVTMEGLKRKDGIREEFPSPRSGNETNVASKSGCENYYSEEALQPTYKDLDHIFDNSDTSSDETFQVPTPPGSNKPADAHELVMPILVPSNGTKCKGLGVLRPEELSKMFPTPPSHEHNPISSPCPPQLETTSLELPEPANCVRNFTSLFSLKEEFVEAKESIVFKPPTSYKMLGSSKYSPINVLPSFNLPLLTVPQGCVYKASWQSPAPSNALPPSNPLPNIAPQHAFIPTSNSNPVHVRPGLSPISPVPNSIRGPSFEMGSPICNAMYLKGLHRASIPHASQALHMQSGHQSLYQSEEAHALIVNLSLSDSVVNLFRDHNFDSCTMCVCNAGTKVVGNIRGSEVGLYIPELTTDDDPVRCNCGFSATTNRRLAHSSGLFYEDEFEIATTIFAAMTIPSDESYERKKSSLLVLDPKYSSVSVSNMDKEACQKASAIIDSVSPELFEILRDISLFDISAKSKPFASAHQDRSLSKPYNLLEYLDANRAAVNALEHGRTIMLEASGRSGYARMGENVVLLKLNFPYMHKWSFVRSKGPRTSQDIMQVMRVLHPILQEAVHGKPYNAQSKVSGPLTWRQFHRLAGRGTDDRCEPQPIPSLLVGSEKDWVALSPLAIRFWEKLLLEPYSYPRDVAYIVVAPDNDFVLQKTRTFFRELSSMFEVCQLGKHFPITKTLRDGILRVGQSAASKLSSQPVDEWFKLLPDIPAAAVLRLYAQVCRHYLAPQLTSISLEHTLTDSHGSNSSNQNNTKTYNEKPSPSPKMPPPGSESSQGPATPKSEHVLEPENPCKDSVHNDYQDQDEEDKEFPAIVVYLVDPLSYASDDANLHRMVSLGLFRSYASMLGALPIRMKENISVQIISLEDVINLGSSNSSLKLKNDQMRALSLTVYSQCRKQLIHTNTAKSLTGFGPAATTEAFLKKKDEKKKLYKLYSPPYILAPTKEKVPEGVEWLGGVMGHSVGGLVSSGLASGPNPTYPANSSSVLYIAYCLSEDQRWLLASATDDRGELLDITTINIFVPNRSKRKKASSRKHGLQKLMDFILGIISTGIQPWRLVVGRLGRVGHGELESWSTLLSRKNLLRASTQLKVSCRQCALQYPSDTPCILSACLVSLEPDSCLRLLPDQFTPDERFGLGSSTSSLSTPQDISCTHILVFPTSATTQSSQTAFQEQHINGPDMYEEDLFLVNISEGMGEEVEDLQLTDIFSWADTGPEAPSPARSPRRDSSSQPGSPGGLGASGRHSPFQSGGHGRASGRGDSTDLELCTILQQPLALGYLVSTAPAGRLPAWFWSSCPERATEERNGVFLKSALHLHSYNVLHNIDDLLQHQSSAKQHPLDSQFTTDVLRFVLEGYNALSWLSLDPMTHDRRSCLPVHMQKLLHLYNTISTLV